MKNHEHSVDCVAFMLIQGNHVLAEKRKRTKRSCLALWRCRRASGGGRAA
jgi:hypothetical protein